MSTLRTMHGKKRHSLSNDKSRPGARWTGCGLVYQKGDHIDPNPKVTCKRCKAAKAKL